MFYGFGGLRRSLQGTSTVGEIVAVINYIMRLFICHAYVRDDLFRISRASASSERINEVLDLNPEIESFYSNKPNEIKGGIEFEKVSFSYSSDCEDVVLSDISFKVNQGETLAILGATGSGKSTLVQLIPRFYEVNCGHIKIDGKSIKDIPTNHLRESIAYVQQNALISQVQYYLYCIWK